MSSTPVEITEGCCDAEITRLPDGGVSLKTTGGGDDVHYFSISKDAWCRLVASVSAQGAAPERIALVHNFHMHGEPPRPPEPGWDANGSPVD